MPIDYDAASMTARLPGVQLVQVYCYERPGFLTDRLEGLTTVDTNVWSGKPWDRESWNDRDCAAFTGGLNRQSGGNCLEGDPPGYSAIHLEAGWVWRIRAVDCDRSGDAMGWSELIVDLWCRSDFNHDGFVNGDDLDEFVVEFQAGGRYADQDRNGFVNGDDFDAFADLYLGGC